VIRPSLAFLRPRAVIREKLSSSASLVDLKIHAAVSDPTVPEEQFQENVDDTQTKNLETKVTSLPSSHDPLNQTFQIRHR
jgi:hypothetical protein